MPMLEPEYDITAEDRAAGEEILLAEIMKGLDALADDRKIMLKLSIPKSSGLYRKAIGRTPQSSARGGSVRAATRPDDACSELAKNPLMIASFSRGLLQDLRADPADEAAFDAALGGAIEKITSASCT